MKIIIIVLLMFMSFTSCEVEDIELFSTIEAKPFISNRDTSLFKTGRYNGEMYINIPGHVDNVNFTYREIYQSGSDYIIRWWTSPDTTAIVNVNDTLFYQMCGDKTPITNCGNQRFIYDYTVKSYRIGDSIFESGNVRFRWYYNGNIEKDLYGVFKAKLKYVDNLTPNKIRK